MTLPAIRRAVGIASLLAAIAISGGCTGSSESTSPGVGTSPEGPPKEVRIGYFANLTHAQAVLGVASGDFERAVAPAKITGRVFNAGPSLIEALFAGEVDVGFVGPGPIINAYAKTKGQGVRVVAGAAANGVVIVVRSDADIEKFEDIKGKRIATPQLGNTQDISARHFLTAQPRRAHHLEPAEPQDVLQRSAARWLAVAWRGGARPSDAGQLLRDSAQSARHRAPHARYQRIGHSVRPGHGQLFRHGDLLA